MFAIEGVALRRAVERIVERGERNVRVARPFRAFEEELGAAGAAELAARSRRRFVHAELIGAGGELDLRRLEPDPGDERGAVRAAATLAMAVRDEARRKAR